MEDWEYISMQFPEEIWIIIKEYIILKKPFKIKHSNIFTINVKVKNILGNLERITKDILVVKKTISILSHRNGLMNYLMDKDDKNIIYIYYRFLNKSKVYRQPIMIDKNNNEYFLVENRECNLFTLKK